MVPNYLCSDGVTVAGPGDCIQSDGGQCYWEIIYCTSAYTGYLRSIDASWCMDACAYYYLESEDGGYISNIADLARFAGGLLNRQLVSSGTEKRMWTRQMRTFATR